MKILSLLAISLFALVVEAAPAPVEKLPELPVEPAFDNGPKSYWVRSVPSKGDVAVPVEPAYANGPDSYWVRDEVTVDDAIANGPTYWAEEFEA